MTHKTKVRRIRERVTLDTRTLAEQLGGYPIGVDACQPVEHPEADLPLDPYLFGAWLGNGNSDAARFTCSREDFEHWRPLFEQAGFPIRVYVDRGTCLQFSIASLGRVKGRGKRDCGPFGNALKAMGVRDNKHIPDCYMAASGAQRLALMQGLMDTDGCCDTRGTATFSNANERIARQVHDLALSLGFKSNFRVNRALVVNGAPYESFEVSFAADEQMPPFQMARKANRCRPRMNSRFRYVRRVEKVPSVPVSCIQVAASDGLYLVGRNLVPTHNSTILTYAKTIQDILASHGDDPSPEWGGIEPTFGIFSHTRPIAKAFLRQIKSEFENNQTLRDLFPDIIFKNPEHEAPWWSEDNGIVVRRRTNPKEATVEAWGLVDGQPTGKHFNVLIYDDVVTLGSVTSPEMIAKTTDAWSLSLNLGTVDTRVRGIGTRYHYNDTYRELMARGSMIPRICPATDDGTLTGNPVYLTREQFEKKVRDMGPYVASAQLLLKPEHDSKQSFKREWLRHFEHADNWKQMNRALLCDPANEKKKTSDYTTMAVVAKGPDNNYYLLDALRDRLNLQERAQQYILMHRKWKPRKSGYEKYGKDADIDYIREVQGRENYRFDIQELGGKLSKMDRINRLIPVFSENRFYMPTVIHRTLHDGKTAELVNVLIEEELLPWPVPVHDDLLDAIARIFDVEIAWPKAAESKSTRYEKRGPSGSWMTA